MIEKIKYQISQGVAMNEKIDGQYVIKLAAESGNIEALKLLIEAGADVNVKCGNYMETPVFFAKNLETLKILVEAGADISARTSGTFHLLHMAVRDGKLDIIEYLVQSFSADVNMCNCMGETPLHIACCHHIFDEQGFNLEIVKFLLKNHARTDVVNCVENTPFVQLLSYTKPLDDRFLKFFKFMLKYTDVTCFRQTKFAINSFVRTTNEKLCKVYLEHVSVLLSLGVTIYSHRYFISRRNNFNDYFEECKNELTLAKSTRLDKSWLTFYNLLVDDNRKLKNYAGNEDLVDALETMDFTSEFPIYGAQMQERIKKGIKRRVLYDKSCILLSDCLTIFNPTHLIVRDILDCSVNTKDLSKFCEE